MYGNTGPESFCGVDLAASSSALVILGLSGPNVRFQDDSFDRTDGQFISTIVGAALDGSLVVIEDLPYHIPYRLSVKDVLRLQGRLIGAMEHRGLLDRMVFVVPSTWQQSFNGVWRGGPKAAQAAALEQGYERPTLVDSEARFSLEGMTGKPRSNRRTKIKKLETDYVDAFLIARWAQEAYSQEPLLDMTGVSSARIGPSK